MAPRKGLKVQGWLNACKIIWILKYAVALDCIYKNPVTR
jgi:hypothetical protein